MSIRRITEEEVQALWVQRLPDTPNRTARFGTAGLSAREMKAAYDALPLRIVEHFNEVVDLILGDGLAEAIGTPLGKSLAAFFRDITSGEAAAYLTVDGTRTLAALAAALDTHAHDGRYVPLSEDGRIAGEYLPESLAELLPGEEERIHAETARATAEAARATAEGERAEAEKKRAEAAAAAESVIAAVREAEEARTVREAAREARLLSVEERISEAEERSETTERTLIGHSITLQNLAAAARGNTHVFTSDTERRYRKTVPEDVLPYARLVALGGASTAMTCAKVTAVVSYGASVLPPPYPAAEVGLINGLTFTPNEDGSILVTGTASEEFTYPLYETGDGLSLPEGGIYVDPLPQNGATLYIATGSTGSAVRKNGACTLSSGDEYYGRYSVYLHFPRGASFASELLYPCITRGQTARSGILYREPHRFDIPEEIRALVGYGYSTNYLYFDKGHYYARLNSSGTLLTPEQYLPLSEELTLRAWIPVEAGGEIVFENDKGAAIRSELLYGVQL
ncbi:MAG: hypothetical protein J6T24_04750 [Clostridia bacterium]|nr:hypothetical protein [Clostridia bacterium]